MTTEEQTLTEKQWHRKMAAELFNHTWMLIEKENRTAEEVDEMIYTAHASRFHWSKAGEPVNWGRGEWQISRVYSVLGIGERALYHASRYLSLCLEHQLSGFDLAYAYEAMARAYSVIGSEHETQKYIALANEAGEQITEDDDKELFVNDMKTISVR